VFIRQLKKCALTVPLFARSSSPLLVWNSNVLYSAEIGLTADDLAEIDKVFPQPGAAAGASYDKDGSHELNI
jgi:hypothetical protein